jgi:hypothetical protein
MQFDFIKKEINIKTEIYLYQGLYTNTKIINSLREKILKNCIQENKNKTNVKGEMTSFGFFNKDPDFLIFLKEIVNELKKCVGPQEGVEIYNSWGNILSKEDDYVSEHNHKQTTLISGVLHLTEEGPGLYFKDFDFTLKEQIGRFILFHPDTRHEVKKFKYTQPRISLAFNLNHLFVGTKY